MFPGQYCIGRAKNMPHPFLYDLVKDKLQGVLNFNYKIRIIKKYAFLCTKFYNAHQHCEFCAIAHVNISCVICSSEHDKKNSREKNKKIKITLEL